MLQLSDKEKEMLKEISENDELAECFAWVIENQIESDMEMPLRKGRSAARHLLENSAPDLLMDLCGWSVETLYEKAKKKLSEECEDEDKETDS